MVSGKAWFFAVEFVSIFEAIQILANVSLADTKINFKIFNLMESD